MNITITAVTPETVCIHGQTLAREYAEVVLLRLLVAAQGQNEAGVFKVAEAFATSGLSLNGSPEASRIYRAHAVEKQAEQARLKAEAEENAKRCRVQTPQEIAQWKSERERKAREIREHGDRLRALRGR